MNEILLIRHAQAAPEGAEAANATLGQPDPPLSDIGLEQAHRLAEYLALRPGERAVRRVFCSDLARARQTAETVAARLACPLEIRPALREIDMGRLFHSTWDEIRQEDPAFVTAWHRHAEDLPYPGGESGADLLRRTLPVLEEVLALPEPCAAIVTHGGNIRALVCHVLCAGMEKRFLVGHPLDNTGVTVLRYDPRRKALFVHAVNDARHLED